MIAISWTFDQFETQLDVRDSGAAAYGQPTANERERRTLKQKVKGLQQARHAAKLVLITFSTNS